jgi:hypothetical protein
MTKKEYIIEVAGWKTADWQGYCADDYLCGYYDMVFDSREQAEAWIDSNHAGPDCDGVTCKFAVVEKSQSDEAIRAATPDLLAMLHKCERFLEQVATHLEGLGSCGQAGNCSIVRQGIRAAIEKAKRGAACP